MTSFFGCARCLEGETTHKELIVLQQAELEPNVGLPEVRRSDARQSVFGGTKRTLQNLPEVTLFLMRQDFTI